MRTVTPVKKTYLDAEATDGGHVDVPPRIITEVRPTAPAAVGEIDSPRSVVLRFLIDPDGRIDQAEVLSADDDRLVPPALEAIARWKIAPAQRDGEPIPTLATAQLAFDPAQR